MQFYRITDFHLSCNRLFEFRYYRLDVRSGTNHDRINWPLCVSAQAVCFTVEWYGDCLAGPGDYLCRREGSAYSADRDWPDVAQCFYLLCFYVLGEKVNAPLEPMAQAAGSIAVSAGMACAMLPFIWQFAPTQIPQAKSLIGLGYAVIMASLIAMFCYFKLVQKIKATTLSLTTVLTPMLALVVGVILNGEKLSGGAALGIVILLAGLLLYFSREIKASYNARLTSSHRTD